MANSSLVLWRLPDCTPLASFPGAAAYAYFPDGKSLAVAWLDGTIEVWDIPPRRPAWIQYGLPALGVVLVLLGIRLFLGWRRGARQLVVPPSGGLPVKPA